VLRLPIFGRFLLLSLGGVSLLLLRVNIALKRREYGVKTA